MKIKGPNGDWVEELDDIHEHISAYFTSLFTAGAQGDDDNVIQKVNPRVTQEMNTELNKPYTREEVKKSSVQHW